MFIFIYECYIVANLKNAIFYWSVRTIFLSNVDAQNFVKHFRILAYKVKPIVQLQYSPAVLPRNTPYRYRWNNCIPTEMLLAAGNQVFSLN